MNATATPPRASAASSHAEPFQFLYFSQLAGTDVIHAQSEDLIGSLYDFNVQATTPYPNISGIHVKTPQGLKIYPWNTVKAITKDSIFLLPDETMPMPPSDCTIRRDLLGKPAVEVSATTVVKIWDLHFVYSENKMVLAHAETGPRGLLRFLGLEKLAMLLFKPLLKTRLRERFATFRHLQVLRTLPDGTLPVPKRILEMHPADLATVLRQLSGRLRRPVFAALSDEAAAAVLFEAEASLQDRLLSDCPKPTREALVSRMKQLRDVPPL